ncbi:MAG: ATP-binding protein [Chitinophagaceae bacterium]
MVSKIKQINALNLVAIFSVTIFFTGCKGKDEIPFPADTGGYQQPVTEPIQFSAPQKLNWPEKGMAYTSSPDNFDYASLPVTTFDTLGFQPFSVPASQVKFEMEKLPAAKFDLNLIPEVPIKFRVSVLPAPEELITSRPQLKSAKEDIIYEFPEPLSGSPVDFVYKSRDGFTWITSGNKLYRFDGERLYRYTIEDLNPPFYNIIEDQEGRLLMNTFGSGFAIIDIRNRLVKVFGKKQGLTSDYSIRVNVDNQNRIWATFLNAGFNLNYDEGKGFVAVVDPQRSTMRIIQEKEGLSANSPTGIARDGSDRIWIGTLRGGVNIFDLEKNQIRYLRQSDGLSNDTLTDITRDSYGNLWIAGFHGSANKVDLNTGMITSFGQQQGLARAFTGTIMHDSKGNHWIGSDFDVRVINPSLTAIKKIDRSSGLTGNSWGSFSEDDRGQIFMSSRSGLHMVHKNGLDIRRFGSSQVSAMLDDDRGQVWVGTTQLGIQIIDTLTGQVRLYDHSHGLSDNFIQFMVNHKGTIIFSTQAGGIEIIDSSRKKVERLGKAQGLGINLTAIEVDDDENIWLGGIDKGLDVLDQRTGTRRHIGEQQGLKELSIIDVKKDNRGRMWFYSYLSGVGYIDPKDKTIRRLVKSKHVALTGATEDNLLLHDSRGNTWVMSSASGLYMINPAGDSVTRISQVNGLLSNSANAIHEHKGRFYVGTSRGLSIITPPWISSDQKWKVESLGKSSGLAKTVATYNSDLMLKDGQYWWGDDGITILKNLEEMVRDTVVPPTYVTGIDLLSKPLVFGRNPWDNLVKEDTLWEGISGTFYSNGQTVASLSASENDGLKWDSLSTIYQLPAGLRLPYNKNYLQFHFAQRHGGSVDTVWYKYIVDGLDQKWSEKTTKPSSENYPNIPSGTYTFKVSSLYRGVWSTPVEFRFTIMPPWWFTWWAWLLYALVAIVLLRAYIVFRSRRLRRENKVLEEKVTLRTKQLQQSIEDLKATQGQLVQSEKMASLGELTAGIAHEIQNPLNFINNFAEINKELLTDMKDELASGNAAAASAIADDVIANEDKINHHGRRADGIVKSMLQHSRSSTHAVKEPTDLNKLADEYLRLAYHGLRAKDKSFNATLKTDFDKNIGMVNLMANDMGRVILNLITNAFYAVGEKALLVKSRQLVPQETTIPGGRDNAPVIEKYEPTVSVSTRKISGKVEIRVKDNGGGIPQRVLDKIFQPFFTTKPAGQGTGLGLSMAYDIVKAHGGELVVDTNENEGTVFSIILPV